MSVLIAYFSATGTTAAAAKRIASLTGGRLFKIEPKVPYTAADLDWTDTNSRSTLEMKNPDHPIAIASLPDLEGVDLLLVGFPIWWYREPAIINSFMKELNANGIKAACFATSGGSGISRAQEGLEKRFSSLNWKPGLRISSAETDEQLRQWLDTVNA